MFRLLGRQSAHHHAERLRGETAEGAPVTVTLFPPQVSTAGNARAARTGLARLDQVSHRAIPRTVAVGMTHGRLAVISRAWGGFPLSAILHRLESREVVLPPALAVALIIEVCEALGRAGEAGVTHGGLTADSIAVDGDGSVWLADLGLPAAVLGPERTFTRAPGAPRRSDAVGVDVYAAGALAYRLLTLGEPPVDARPLARRERLVPPSRLVRGLDARIDPVILRALETDPRRRTPTCAELARGLGEVLVAHGGIPPLSGLARLAAELFPAEVAVKETGTVPFTSFELEPEGAVVSQVTDDRPTDPSGPGDPPGASPRPAPFGLDPPSPADRPTEIDRPPSRAPREQARRQRRAGEPRLHVFEDPPAGPPPARELPTEPPRRTVMTFATPFARASPSALHRVEQLLARSRRRARVAAVVGTLVLTASVATVTLLALTSHGDPASSVLAHLPPPIARALEPDGPPASLEVRVRARVEDRAPACHRPPSGKAGVLELVTPRKIRVRIDGHPVCEAGPRIRVAPGAHAVVVEDLHTGQVFSATLRPAAGRTVQLRPTFP